MHDNKELLNVKTTFYAFADFSEYKIHNSLEDALADGPIYVFKEIKGYWENGNYKNVKYVYAIYDSEGNEVDRVRALRPNNNSEYWELIGPSVWMGAYFKVQEVSFTIKDPHGSESPYYFGDAIIGIIRAMRYLASARKYYSRAQHEIEICEELWELKSNELKS